MDAAQIRRVEALAASIKTAIDRELDASAMAVDVLLAVIVRAVVMSKLMKIGDNQFFDLVVKMYESTTLESMEKH